MTAPIGIDLGTSNSVVAVMRDGRPTILSDVAGSRLQPSVVSWTPGGKTLVGVGAVERLSMDPVNTVRSAKRLMGRPFYSPEAKRVADNSPWAIEEGPNKSCIFKVQGRIRVAPEDIAAQVLRHLVGIAEWSLGARPQQAVISVPATFREAQRNATLRAGERAGLEVLRLVNEPTAAALAFGFGVEDRTDQRIAVYDLGGGTFDITILEQRGHVFEVLATSGDTFLGGDDLDDSIANLVADAFEEKTGVDPRHDRGLFQRLRVIAERVKCEVGESDEASAKLVEVMPGHSLASGLDFRLDRSTLDHLTTQLVQRTLVTCDEALRLARIQASDVDQLVLVGGSTRLAVLREMVATYFGREFVDHGINPDEIVALGAAIYADALSQPSWGDAPIEAEQRSVTNPGFAARLEEERTQIGIRAFDPDERESNESAPGEVMEVEHTSVGIPSFRGDSESARDDEDAPATVRLEGAVGYQRTSTAPLMRKPTPLLIDVTSHGIGVATLGDLFDEVIERNSKVPVARTREFTTSRDNQTRVRLRILEGSERKASRNDTLGELLLIGLRSAPRGAVKVEVTLSLDTNATLDVFARDVETGQEASAQLKIAGLSDVP